MKCTTCRKLISKAQQDHLSAIEEKLKAEHLQTCRACKALWDKEQLLLDTLHALPTVEVEDSLNGKMWAAIQERSNEINNRNENRSVYQNKWLVGAVAAMGCFLIIWMAQPKVNQHNSELAGLLNETENVEIPQKTDTTAGINVQPENLKEEKNAVAKQRGQKDLKIITKVDSHPQNALEHQKVMQKKTKQAKVLNQQRKQPEFLKSRKDKLVRRARIVKNSTTTERRSIVGAAAVRSGLATIEVDIISEMPKIYKNKINLNQQESTRFVFGMIKQGKVQLTIYSRSGKRIKTLVNEQLDQGQYQYEWDGSTESGAKVGTGIYFMVFSRSGDKAQRYKIVVLR